jgi:septal ring factor EnvC (AmiA/AmiB activator)
MLAAALMLAMALVGLNASHAYGQSVDELRSSIGQMRKQLEAQEQRLQQLESPSLS